MTKNTFETINIGQSAEYIRTITEEDIVNFAEVSGDHNPVHLDEDFAKQTMFKGRIAHGMLSAFEIRPPKFGHGNFAAFWRHLQVYHAIA